MNSSSFRPYTRAALLACLLACAGAAVAQQAAGRFLIAIGTVTVQRGAERIPAATGMEVRQGDTVQLDAQSNAQIRFTDGAVMALRPGTTLRVTEYSHQQAGGKESAGFDLVKGGLRTITGLLGRRNPDEYQVRTPTATIGIRGTHYVLRVCDDDCDEGTGTAQAGRIYVASASSSTSDAGPIAQAPAPTATRAPNGTYGTVSEGRISVANQSGERVFGADQYFHVASSSAAAQQLVAPPAFIRDRLDGRGRSERRSAPSSAPGGSQQQSSQSSAPAASGGESAPTVAQTGQGGGAGDTRVSSATTTPVVSLAITPTLTQVTNQLATAPASILELTGSSANLTYRLASNSLSIPTSCASPPCGNITAADLIVVVNPTSQTARIVLAFALDDGGKFNLNNAYGDFPVQISGNQLVINGSANSADHPTQQGSFRCNDCGPGGSVGTVISANYSVTIANGQATLTVSIVDLEGGGSATAVLPQATFPPSVAAAAAGRNFGNNGGSGVYAQVDAAGQPVFVGEPLGIGCCLTSFAGTTSTTVGGDPAAGNLKWGYASGQATGVNGSYLGFTQVAGSVSPWITGTATNVLPASLGTATFTPIGHVIGSGGGVAGMLNSASMTADFVNRHVALSINAYNGVGGTYQMSGGSSFSAINGRFSAGWSSISCTGSCGTGSLTGGFNGFFAGANAVGAGVAFNASATGASVFGAVGFKKQ